LADFADDPTLRAVVKAARAWGISPSRFMGARHVVTYEYDIGGRITRAIETPEWTEEDRELAFALEEYEAGLCPGCNQPLDETTKPEHADAYQPNPPERCHYCTARELHSEAIEKQNENPAGLLVSYRLNPDVVEQNLLPAPPLPPELQGFDDDQP